MWTAIEEEEDIDEIQRVLQTFIFSVFIQRVHHAILEVGRGHPCNQDNKTVPISAVEIFTAVFKLLRLFHFPFPFYLNSRQCGFLCSPALPAGG